LTQNTWHQVWHQTFMMPLHLTTFSRFGNSLATFPTSFTQGDWSAYAAIAFYDLGMSSARRTAEQRAAEGSLRF
jgi:hypothetical protein